MNTWMTWNLKFHSHFLSISLWHQPFGIGKCMYLKSVTSFYQNHFNCWIQNNFKSFTSEILTFFFCCIRDVIDHSSLFMCVVVANNRWHSGRSDSERLIWLGNAIFFGTNNGQSALYPIFNKIIKWELNKDSKHLPSQVNRYKDNITSRYATIVRV